MIAALPELGSQQMVAEQFGCDRSTVSRALQDPDVTRLAQIKKREIGAGFADLTQKLLKRYSEQAENATLDNKGVVLLGICADKTLLYNNEPTSITETRNDASLKEEARRLFEEYMSLTGDAAEAARLLSTDAPTLSRYIN